MTSTTSTPRRTTLVRTAERGDLSFTKNRRERGLGAGVIQQTESEWNELIAMLELAQRWQELIGEFTSEDAHPRWRQRG